MGVRDYIPLAGGRGTDDSRVHRECRECGRNLRGGRDDCPDCGGTAAVYEL